VLIELFLLGITPEA